jgi:beta-galactosidase
MAGRLFGLALAIVVVVAFSGFSETYTGEASNRAKINLGETPWKFIKSDPAGGVQTVAFKDASWKDVGIPHTYNDTDTFINQQSGGGDGSMFGQIVWYRKHFTVDNAYLGRKIFVEFQGVHVGCQVYINNTFLKGNSAVAADSQATHVIGFMGFVVDITQYVQFGGADNVLAVRVGKYGGFYEDPGFSTVFRFGSEDGGIFRPVYMHITDNVHVPLNLYSVINQWGTYVATTAIAGDGTNATVRMLTNVRNDGAASQNVTVTTKVVDRTNTVVLSLTSAAQSVAGGQSSVFDQTGTVTNPHLWYPNASIYGTPYMYKVYHIVQVAGATVDVFESPLGIRTITWDANFPYINGHKHMMDGASARYDYPALGTALPLEIEYRDALHLAGCGGRLWRPGHSACSPNFVYACDNTGVMLIQPSGDGEGLWSTAATADEKTIKLEVQRDGVIRDRNNPSILAWEVCNGDINAGFCTTLRTLCQTWDSLAPRVISVRGAGFGPKDLISCTVTGCEMGMKNGSPGNPAWGAEAWGNADSRTDYNGEISFANQFMNNWSRSEATNCFGLCQWYLAETPGECQAFMDGTPATGVRSFGSSMMDFNRLPKMLYKMYAAAWTPFAFRPVVYLAHHWNRSGAVTVNAFSNCPSVELLLNGNSLGKKTPTPLGGASWSVNWAAGTLLANGLDAGGKVVCSDQKQTAGNPDHIVLIPDAPVVQANGDTFQITANGTDAKLILAKVVDANEITVPTASNVITFNVSGPGNYRGGANQYVTAGQPLGYHAPLDTNLAAEGGLIKVAIRSTFTPGVVAVTATSPNLGRGTASFTVVPVPPNPFVAVRPAPHAAASVAIPAFQVRAGCGVVRYYVGAPSFVSLEIVAADGRIVAHMSRARKEQGWHSVPLNDRAGGLGLKAGGVYFVHLAAEGGYRYVKPVVLLR